MLFFLIKQMFRLGSDDVLRLQSAKFTFIITVDVDYLFVTAIQ